MGGYWINHHDIKFQTPKYYIVHNNQIGIKYKQRYYINHILYILKYYNILLISKFI